MLELELQKQLDAFKLDMQLCAPEEKIIVLFGPSGAGKSMTLAAIAGLTIPDAGCIAIGERVLFDAARGINLSPQQRCVGLVRQDLALFPHLTVEENIAYGLFRESRTSAQKKTRDFLELMHLNGLGKRRPAELSGGQQQRVALARALATQPALLLLDEPFSALDQAIRMELRDELRALQRNLRTSVLFITHDVGEAYQLADYLAVIDAGKVLQFGAPEAVLRTPSSERVARIVGAKIILPATIASAGCIRIGDRELEAETKGWSPGSPAFVSLPPERLTLVLKDRPTILLPNIITGHLIHEKSDGSNVSLFFRADAPRLRPDQPFDLVIDTPMYVYERLSLDVERDWTISIKPGVIHLIPTEPEKR